MWLRNALSQADFLCFDDASANNAKAGRRLGPSTALDRALGDRSSLMQAIRKIDPQAKPVRVVSINKSESANGGVLWHQDRVIAVTERAELAGFRNWTAKSGAWHCEPPQSVLDGMLFVRVHLDDTDRSNGAMEIALGSHAKGIVPASDAERESLGYPIEICEAGRGDVLILKMLTLHCSKPAHVMSGRRA